MNMVQDDLLAPRFAALANPLDDSDWTDVRRRLGAPRHRRPLLVAGLAAALAAVAIAVAFGWPQSFINFLSAPPAPKKVKNSFGAQNVIAPPGMNPRAIPNQARRVMSARFDATGIHPGHGSVHILYVTPTRDGSFCYEWTRFTGSCAPSKKSERARPGLRRLGPLGVTWLGNQTADIATGYVLAGKAKTLQAQFADGTTTTIPVAWVSAPINAGFFLYIVPANHRQRTTALLELTARDSAGRTVGRQLFPLSSPLDEQVPRVLPDGTRVSLSRRAELATAQKLISFRASNGSQVWLWAMKRRGGGRCYVFNQGSGCPPPHVLKTAPPFAGGLTIGTRRVLFFAQAEPRVTSIELHYQNGSIERVTPAKGFVLHEITSAHYALRARLTKAVALDASGKILQTQSFQPQSPGVYPCSKPIARGYGVKSCP
jgi:hypothetical protein